MKLTSLLTGSLLAATLGLSLSSCGNDDPQPLLDVAYIPQNVPFQLGMTEYASQPQVVGRFGVAKSLNDALIGNGTELKGKISWIETRGGKEGKTLVLPNQQSGTTRWVYLSTAVKPTGNQAITLALNSAVDKVLVLNAAAADTIVIREITIP